MAKFCGNCGRELEDTVRVCGYCGTPTDDMTQSIAGVGYKNPESKGNAKKIVKRILVIAIIVGLLFGGFKAITEFTGYKGLVRKVMKAYENYDIDCLIDMSSDVYFYETEDFVRYYFENNVGTDLDYYENSVGHNYKLSYEVDEIYEVSERKLAELEGQVQTIYEGFDMSMVEKVAIADLNVTAENGRKTVNRDVVLTLTKESGEWRLLYME